VFARRLQSQERMNGEILSAIDLALKPRGAAVMLIAEHQCMTLRNISAGRLDLPVRHDSSAFPPAPRHGGLLQPLARQVAAAARRRA